MNIKSILLSLLLLFLLIIPLIRYLVGAIKNFCTNGTIKKFQLDNPYVIKIEKSEHKKIEYIKATNGQIINLGKKIQFPYKVKFTELNKNIFQKIFRWDQMFVQVYVKKI